MDLGEAICKTRKIVALARKQSIFGITDNVEIKKGQSKKKKKKQP